MSAGRTIRALIDANHAAIERAVAVGAGPELLAILRDAQKDLGERLRYVNRYRLEERWTGQQSVAARASIEDAIRHTKLALERHLKAKVEVSSEKGAHDPIAVLRAAEKAFRGVAYQLPVATALRMDNRLTGMTSTLLRQHPTSVDRYGTRMIGEFERTMRSAVLHGVSVGDMVDRLVGHGGPRGRVSLAAATLPNGRVQRLREEEIPEGLFVRHRYWAIRIVRTEMMYAYNAVSQATIEELAEDFEDMARVIIATFDRATAQDSVFVHGEVRGVREPFIDGAGRVYLHPPARPNDREIVVPHRRSWPLSEIHAPRPKAERLAAAEAAGGDDTAHDSLIRSEVQAGAKTKTRAVRYVSIDEVHAEAARISRNGE